MPRIISGSARGLRLRTPSGRATRPTTDRIKETLFNIIAFGIPGTRVADFFAGTGSLGLEAVSRGAVYAAFAENSSEALRVIRGNIELTGFGQKCRLYPVAAIAAARKMRADDGPDALFDYIFMDPPYSKGHADVLLAEIRALGLLAPRGTIVVETGADEAVDAAAAGFELKDRRVYGITALWFLGNTVL